DRKTRRLSVLLDDRTDVAEVGAGTHLADAEDHGLVRPLNQPPGEHARLPHVVHAAGVAVEAVLYDGDVDIHDVAGRQHLVAGDAVADHMVDRRADRARKRRARAPGGVTDGRGLATERAQDVLAADVVELTRG